MGAFFSITAPTLPTLASNMGVTLAVAQTAISIRSIAVMMGSLIPDFVFSKVQPLLFLAVAITVNGVALAMIPTFTNIVIFNICITVTGFTFGIARDITTCFSTVFLLKIYKLLTKYPVPKLIWASNR